ncbi:MAG: HEAT repeat domain-containing protein [Deltaproteobacteria bacterium]|nr:HEAT repeat domain-containing protein [Deltaproteobacteria bacterium]
MTSSSLFAKELAPGGTAPGTTAPGTTGTTAAETTAARTTTTPSTESPYVEIVESEGMVDGPSDGPLATPRWDKVGVEIEIRNRLEVPVSSIELEIGLVRARLPASDAHAPIAGWSFREKIEEEIGPEERARLRITKPLAARRASLKAEDIAYRVHVLSYRVMPPSPDLAMRLLQSMHESDQRAALKSYEDLEGLTLRERSVVRAELALELDRFRNLARARGARAPEPSPSAAFRLLFVIRSLGALGDAADVPTLLEIPEHLEHRAWGRAIAELSARLDQALPPLGPDARSEVLPTWTRDPMIAAIRGADALEEATDQAILRMGDAAVPGLIEAAHRPDPDAEAEAEAEADGTRGRALRLLHMLGRSTPRSQLALRDIAARLRVIEVLGSLSAREAVDALIEGLSDGVPEVRARTKDALMRIGPPAVAPLVERLGQPNHEDLGLTEILLGMDDRAEKILRTLAAERHIALARDSPRMRWIEQLGADARRRHERKVADTIESALELERSGNLREAITLVDPLIDPLTNPKSNGNGNGDDKDTDHGASPMADEAAAQIAKLYAERGAQLLDQGNFDAACATLERSLKIHPTPRAQSLFVGAALSLARGYRKLGELDRAEQALDLLDDLGSVDESEREQIDELEAVLLADRADQAMDRGEYSRARKLLVQAQAQIQAHDHPRERPEQDPFVASQRRLFIMENLATVIIFALLVPAVAITLLLALLSRASSRKMQHIEQTLDGGSR